QQIANTLKLKRQLLQWAQQFPEIVWLDSNDYQQTYGDYDAILAVDAFTSLQTDYINGFDKLREYQSHTDDWIFGYLAYDLKNDVEHLKSNNHDGLGFPDLCFFQPKKLFLLKGDVLEVRYLRMVDDEIESDLREIHRTQIPSLKDIAVKRLSAHEPAVKIKLRIHKDEYHEKVNTM
ncbi:unnamed protein product, partial [Ectocarpus sp. 4 AP-2014]